VVRLTIAPEAPVASTRRITVVFSGGDHPYDDQSLAGFSFALNDSVVTAGVPGATAPLASRLVCTAPNPTHGSVEITFTLASPGEVDLRIYDVRGTAVRTLVQGTRAAGPQSSVWDGRNTRGSRVGPGVYFVKLSTRDGVRRTKVVRID
jgi:hypothetical protein